MPCHDQGWLEKPLLLARAPYDKAVFFDADVLIEHPDVAHLFAWLEAERHDFMAVTHRTRATPAPNQLCTRLARALHALRTARALHPLPTPLCIRSAHAPQVREVNTSRSRRGASQPALPPGLPILYTSVLLQLTILHHRRTTATTPPPPHHRHHTTAAPLPPHTAAPHRPTTAPPPPQRWAACPSSTAACLPSAALRR